MPALKRVPKPCSKSKGKQIKNSDLIFSEYMSDNMYNVQIPYDMNQTVDLESWNSKFNSISLYGSIKHLATNIINIKESLHCIEKYILNKKIKQGKANIIVDLRGIGKAAWSFISSIYEAG